MKGFAIALSSALLITACSIPSQTGSTREPVNKQDNEHTSVSDENKLPALPPGSNEILRTPLVTADGIEVIISDVVIPPDEAVPRHYHLGEEFAYIIEGSVVHVEEGKPEFILRAGESVVLSPRVVHKPRGTGEGARVIVFRVHPEGAPERILVEEEAHSHDSDE